MQEQARVHGPAQGRSTRSLSPALHLRPAHVPPSAPPLYSGCARCGAVLTQLVRATGWGVRGWWGGSPTGHHRIVKMLLAHPGGTRLVTMQVLPSPPSVVPVRLCTCAPVRARLGAVPPSHRPCCGQSMRAHTHSVCVCVCVCVLCVCVCVCKAGNAKPKARRRLACHMADQARWEHCAAFGSRKKPF